MAISFRKLYAMKRDDFFEDDDDNADDDDDDDDPIANLELPLEIPGSPSYPLRVLSRTKRKRRKRRKREQKATDIVNSENIDQYIIQVARSVCIDGIAIQANAFRYGFVSFMSCRGDAMTLFDAKELLSIVCGSNDDDLMWSESVLETSISFDHGYSKDSRFAKNFIRLLTSFDKAKRRAFLCFTTGCPRLPIGGFDALTPPLTVVRKSISKRDAHLPSASTCTHYLKVPEYSNYELMRKKFYIAITEGSLGFLMS
jgi:E3 ubiquitin-protein ligase TRIP12